jgi:hypothetical protein
VDPDLHLAGAGFERQIDIAERKLMLALEDKRADFGHRRFPSLVACP